MIWPPNMNEPAAGDSRLRALIGMALGKAAIATITRTLHTAKIGRAARDERLRKVLEGVVARLRGEVA
jgi:hypothetical protein